MQLLEAEIIEQHDIDACFDRLADLFEILGLDLDTHAGGLVARGRNRSADRSGRRDVVLLDEHQIVQPLAVIRGPAAAHGVLLRTAQSGDRLARVEDPAARAGNCRDVALRDGRGRRKQLQEVQRGALPGQQRACRPCQLAQHRLGGHRRALCVEPAYLHRRVELTEGLIEPGAAT